MLRKSGQEVVIDGDLTTTEKAELDAYACLLAEKLFPALVSTNRFRNWLVLTTIYSHYQKSKGNRSKDICRGMVSTWKNCFSGWCFGWINSCSDAFNLGRRSQLLDSHSILVLLQTIIPIFPLLRRKEEKEVSFMFPSTLWEPDRKTVQKYHPLTRRDSLEYRKKTIFQKNGERTRQTIWDKKTNRWMR